MQKIEARVSFDPAINDALASLVKEELDKLFQQRFPPVEPIEFVTRKEAAKKYGISLPTLDNYTRTGIVNGYRFGSRVRYKLNELEASLSQIRTQ